jgi:hypothetical protein
MLAGSGVAIALNVAFDMLVYAKVPRLVATL